MNTKQRLYTLCQELGEVESQLVPLQAERDRLRAELFEVVEQAGGKTSIPGFGSLELIKSTVTVSYDRKLVDALIIRLLGEGQEEIAQVIQKCRKESMRTGSIRITREHTQTV